MAWRLQRLMLTPAFRVVLRVGLPVALVGIVGLIWLGSEDRRAALRDSVLEVRRSIENRPEFMVQLMQIDGASETVAEDIREAVSIDFPVSSFELDTQAIRALIQDLDPVRSVAVRVRPGGVLQVDIEPRVPAAVWRSREGLHTIDETGAHIASLTSRTAQPDLPLVAGDGADRVLPEALALYQAAAPLHDRLRGIVRVAQRRWDVVLDRGQRILLPETGAIEAFERVIALDSAQDILGRDVARVDMRLADRPTVQMNQNATREWWNIRQLSGQ
jgi:cell division protein FtsQ